MNTMFPKLRHSGAGTGLPEIPLSSFTKPPPKFATSVKVCVSPPRFSIMVGRPTFICMLLG